MTIPTFPPLAGLAYPTKRRPNMSTLKTRSINGKVNALQMMAFPYWNYELPYSFLRAADPNLEFQTLTAFFLGVGGAAGVFQFNDVDDGEVVAQGFGVGDGAATQFQLVRTFNYAGAFTFTEPVYAPLVISEITVASVPTTAYAQDTGLVTFDEAPAPGAALAWTGTYNWLARFDEDTQDFEKFADKFWRLNKITFTTEIV